MYRRQVTIILDGDPQSKMQQRILCCLFEVGNRTLRLPQRLKHTRELGLPFIFLCNNKEGYVDKLCHCQTAKLKRDPAGKDLEAKRTAHAGPFCASCCERTCNAMLAGPRRHPPTPSVKFRFKSDSCNRTLNRARTMHQPIITGTSENIELSSLYVLKISEDACWRRSREARWHLSM